jgi:SAM-dependent methyltransferase
VSAARAGAGTSVAECFLCRTTSRRVVWTEMGYEARRCTCGMVYTSPMPAPGSIDRTIDHHPQEFYSYPAPFKARWVARHCPPGRLLEVGCGEGFFLAAARTRGYEVVGLEVHAGRAQQVRDTLGIEVTAGALEDDRLRPAQFDVVYHCDLLAHFADPIAALRSMTRLLRPDGVLCFEVGMLGGISPFWYTLTGGLGLGYHLWLYSPGALRELLTRADLGLEHVQRFGLAPRAVLGGLKAGLRGLLGRSPAASIRSGGSLPAAGTRRRLGRSISNFLRYRGAAWAPRIGPETWLLVARPVPRDRGQDARP